jgi:hypothetical protein
LQRCILRQAHAYHAQDHHTRHGVSHQSLPSSFVGEFLEYPANPFAGQGFSANCIIFPVLEFLGSIALTRYVAFVVVLIFAGSLAPLTC